LSLFNSEEEKQCLSTNYKIPDSCLSSTDAPNLATDLMSATDGKGIDIVLAGLGASHLTRIWGCLARNGKFVFTGGADVPDMAVFDISVFSRGATFHPLIGRI
jgi:NADPH:quinone reductase-like Zn-dependent oxidoreductase